jgi:hypothetical protein
LSARLRDTGVVLEYVDLGGGLGISYDGGEVPSAADYVAALVEAVRHTSLPIVVEPGRSIAGPAGVLLAPITFIHSNVGLVLGLKAFPAAVLGGFGSIPGAVGACTRPSGPTRDSRTTGLDVTSDS